ncbi:unnamed protein product [Darwinula stevensoni]|uniref:DDB1- and CUL4-associated factor 5 n=1 Tax=Darwinula stevensoni TaxID=69355 RepID=A0A7R8X376_9CRUS|nr:unnamed protein product [Darwinula stevensoni]CAG0884685.1 unnamed protein product [Darwinula stevensoni]
MTMPKRSVNLSAGTWSTNCHPVVALTEREYLSHKKNPKAENENFLLSRFRGAENLYRKNLHAHFGCVNALQFSKDGKCLMSGGDDARVLLWDVGRTLHGNPNDIQPAVMKTKHNSNIFTLDFDSRHEKIFSGGNDQTIIIHDVETGEPVDVFRDQDAIYGISVHPQDDNCFTTAVHNGSVLLYDIRAPPSEDPVCLAKHPAPFHAVMFNPCQPNLVATANVGYGVNLYDVRSPRICLRKYGKRVGESAMNVRWNDAGTLLLALRRSLSPIVFAVGQEEPLYEFYQPGYVNECTMKSCTFGGPNDRFVISGSDDFKVYIWEIPQSRSDNGERVDGASLVLKGHRSIVNQVRYEPYSCLLASCGVEKIIKLWSPFEIPYSSGGLRKDCPTEDKERQLCSRNEYIQLVLRTGQLLSHDYSDQSKEEDPRMMAFFDALLHRELNGWSSDDSNSSVHSFASSIPVESDSQSSSSSSSESSEEEEMPERGTEEVALRPRREPSPESLAFLRSFFGKARNTLANLSPGRNPQTSSPSTATPSAASTSPLPTELTSVDGSPASSSSGSGAQRRSFWRFGRSKGPLRFQAGCKQAQESQRQYDLEEAEMRFDVRSMKFQRVRRGGSPLPAGGAGAGYDGPSTSKEHYDSDILEPASKKGKASHNCGANTSQFEDTKEGKRGNLFKESTVKLSSPNGGMANGTCTAASSTCDSESTSSDHQVTFRKLTQSITKRHYRSPPRQDSD